MRIRKLVSLSLLAFSITMFLHSAMGVYASDLDELTGDSSTETTETTTEQSTSSDTEYNLDSIDTTVVTTESLEWGAQHSSGFNALIGNIVGLALSVLGGILSLITVSDMAYALIPRLRDVLYSLQTPNGKPRQWISDEMLAAHTECMSNMAQPQNRPQPQGMGIGMNNGFGNNGFGNNAFGNNGFNNTGFNNNTFGNTMMPGAQQQQQPAQAGRKLLLTTYFKKRAVTIIFAFICLILLTSSVLMDCGINFAELGLKVISKLSNALDGVSF